MLSDGISYQNKSISTSSKIQKRQLIASPSAPVNEYNTSPSRFVFLIDHLAWPIDTSYSTYQHICMHGFSAIGIRVLQRTCCLPINRPPQLRYLHISEICRIIEVVVWIALIGKRYHTLVHHWDAMASCLLILRSIRMVRKSTTYFNSRDMWRTLPLYD